MKTIIILTFLFTSVLATSSSTFSSPPSQQSGFHIFGDDENSCLPSDDRASLDVKSSKADVVMTATILNVMREDSPLLLDKPPPDPATRRSGRTVSALVKVWNVMKGSLDDVVDRTRTYRRFKRSANAVRHSSSQHSGIVANMSSGTELTKELVDTAVKSHSGSGSQIVELHGLWNSYFCGSFLQEGDTRVFFLRKLLDHREPLKREKRSSKKGKGRKRKCKKRKRKMCKKRSKKLEWKKVFKLSGKTKASRRAKMKTKSRPSSLSSSSSNSPSTLLVNGEPSRITLTNLNNVKSVIHA